MIDSHFKSSLDSLVENMDKNYFKYLNQEFDNNILDFLKKKNFILINIWVIFESLKKNCQAKKS